MKFETGRKSQSNVKVMHLTVRGQRMEIASIGAGKMILRNCLLDSVATEGELFFSIDGVEKVDKVIVRGLVVGRFVEVLYEKVSDETESI